MMSFASFVITVWFLGFFPVENPPARPTNPSDSSAALQSIANQYRQAANRIIQSTLAGNDSYKKLTELCDGIGHRLSGSPELEQAVAWAVETLKRDGQENVRAEPVLVPHWVRGRESLIMTSPRVQSLAMLGLGGSVGTPPGGITAPLVSVSDEADLEAIGEKARGKIVLFDNPMPPYDPERGAGYGTAVRFRSRGASLAAEKGAVACLVRSVTARSLRSPHTGALRYVGENRKIPAAAVSIEDAAMLTRMVNAGMPVSLILEMEARSLDPAPSANVVAELRGSDLPEDIIVISGHLDSWDVGQGAHDDAGGCVQAMEAVNVLRRLKMIPRRTIRVVLWTNEENGLAGAKQYVKDHADEMPRHVAAIESDGGSFHPNGYSLECADKKREKIAIEQLSEILSLLSTIGPMKVETGGSGADVGQMKEAGVVLMGHNVENSTYFDYHHSHADTIDKVDPDELSRNVAVMAVVAYVLADMPTRIGDAR